MKNIKLIIFLITIIAFSLFASSRSYALEPELKREIKQDIKEDVKEKVSTKPGLLQRIAGKLARAAIINGTISAKEGTTLAVTKDGKTYTVQTDGKTQFRRRFWGKGSLEELQVGHNVNVHGRWTDEAQTTIQAVLLRDLSAQKRFGVFMGNVTSLIANGWVMQTVARGSQTVTVSSNTRFVNRKGETIAQSDIAAGHRVRVKGLWNSKNNTITEVTHVKDFSLPPVPTKSQ